MDPIEADSMQPLGLCGPIHDCNEEGWEVDCSVRGMLFAMKRRESDGSSTANLYFQRVASIESRWCLGSNRANTIFDMRLFAKLNMEDEEVKKTEYCTDNGTELFAYLTA